MRIINFNLFPTLKAENISQPEKYLWPATKIKIDSFLGRCGKSSGLWGGGGRQDLVPVPGPRYYYTAVSVSLGLLHHAILLYNANVLGQLDVSKPL